MTARQQCQRMRQAFGRRWVSFVRASERHSRESESPAGIVVLACWFGLATGLFDVIQLVIRSWFEGAKLLGGLQINGNFTWMIPVADLIIFAACGLILGVVGAVVPRRGVPVAIFVLSFLSSVALLLAIPGLPWVVYVVVGVCVSGVIAPWLVMYRGTVYRVARFSFPLLLITTGLLAGERYAQLEFVKWRERASTRPSSSVMPSVLLIVMDTVRASNLSVYGYARDTTPNLKRLAGKGVRFDHARATAPWTLPSHASMFTGRWPHQLSVGEDRGLDALFPTLAEVLTDRGYATGGFVANTHFCNTWFGLQRGFTHYEDMCNEYLAVSLAEVLHCSMLGQRLVALCKLPLRPDRSRKDARRINGDFLDWVSQHDGRPFFAFLNYFDAHDPYLLPDDVAVDAALRPRNLDEFLALLKWNQRPKHEVPGRLNELVHDAYDDCITYIDRQVGQLLDEMDRRGLSRNTMVIITSDHGEQLGEHGLYLHGRSLYREEVHVPLLIIPPGGLSHGLVIRDPVSLRDLPATVVDVAGLETDSPFPGVSLARAWKSSSPLDQPSSSPVLTQVALREGVSNNKSRPPAWRGPMHSLVRDGKVYIRNANGEEELYDLEADPGERNDLAENADSEPILERFRNVLGDLLGKEPPSK